ncbi:MAG TPA: glycosyltransferase [Actinomycetota bacterium]|nr:glycosyltransferase [Actinomycetota bacterium]
MPNLTTFAVRSHDLHAAPPTRRAGLRLAILVPTRNEAANIETLLERTRAAVAGIPTEVVFIDDSDDDTPAAIRAARRTAGGAFQVSLIHRQGSRRSGRLGGAVLDGLRTVVAPWACVMDADLQHPPELIPTLLAVAEREHADLAIASRHCASGHADGLGPARSLVSAACKSAARLLFLARLRGVTDPMSGFFLVRMAALELDRLRPRGFKILVELLVRGGGGLRRTEVGFTFADRHAGQSKGSLREGLSYLGSLCELRLDRRAPAPSRPGGRDVALD